MQRSTLPPPHPSLPRNPNPNTAYQEPQASSSYAYPSYYGSHYAQAYYGQSNPTMPSPTGFFNPISNASVNQTRGPVASTHLMSSWYQPGNNRCSHAGCTFAGSQKSVEVHMMDRHLIFPPGWDKKYKKQSQWDADPSLKGKSIPIQGTNVILDTPEVIDAWIAERKARFPSSGRVEEKKRKMDEAIARGQLDLSDTRGNKRRKVDGQASDNRQGKNFRGHPQSQRSNNRGRNASGQEVHARPRIPDTGWPRKQSQDQATVTDYGTALQRPMAALVNQSDSDDSDMDDKPEVLSSKLPVTTEEEDPVLMIEEPPLEEMLAVTTPTESILHEHRRSNKPLHPRGPPRNPFASRPTLLRNLLLPEIRMTVSNLSQGIRFLVDNDFLRNVELKPGQAAEQHKIHVLDKQH